MLVQCLKDSVVHMATVVPPSTPQEVGGERGGAPEAVVVFSGKVVELSKCVAQMGQHMATLVLQQKRAHLVSGRGRWAWPADDDSQWNVCVPFF